MQYLGPVQTNIDQAAALGLDSSNSICKIVDATVTANGLMAAADKKKLNSMSTELCPRIATLTGTYWMGVPVYRQCISSTFPAFGSGAITIISGVTRLLGYTGWVRRNNGQHHLISLIGVSTGSDGHISPIFYTGTGIIQIYNNSGGTEYNGQPYQVSIEFTKA